MRITVVLTCIMAVLVACSGGENTSAGKIMEDTTRYTTIAWQDTVVRFDTLTMGQQTIVTFKFTNTGDKPLVITDVKASCGCTIAEYTEQAVPPGGEGFVKGLFDSNRSNTGLVRKNLLVTANTRNGTRHTLIFTGIVKEIVNNPL